MLSNAFWLMRMKSIDTISLISCGVAIGQYLGLKCVGGGLHWGGGVELWDGGSRADTAIGGYDSKQNAKQNAIRHGSWITTTQSKTARVPAKPARPRSSLITLPVIAHFTNYAPSAVIDL